MKSSKGYVQLYHRRAEFCGTFALRSQEDKAGQPKKTEKERPAGGYRQAKWFTVSNNADRLNEVEESCDLKKQFQWNNGNKSLNGANSRQNENRQMIY